MNVPIDAMRNASGLLQAGRYSEAHVQLERIVTEHPDFTEALRLLGGCKFALGDVAGAETSLRRARALDPNWAPTLTTLGELLLGSGRVDEAEPLLRRAATRDPRAALVFARFCNDQRRPADALAIVAPFCATGQADAELVAQQVAALAALGRADEAVDIYRRLTAAAPNSPLAAHALAIAFDAANRPSDAQRAVQTALAAGLKTAAVHYTHARSLIALDEFDRAETALRDCVRQEPRHVDAQNRLARLIWMRTGDSAQSTAALDDALRVFGDDEVLLAAKAAVLQGAGNAQAAYACLAAKAEQSAAAPSLLIRAGLAALDFDAAAALAFAERALRVQSANAAALSLLVAAQLGIGDARSALRHCETLLAASPDDQYLIALQTTAWRLLGDARYDEFCDYARLVVPASLDVSEEFLVDVKRSLDRLHDRLHHPLLFQSLRNGTETTGDLARSDDAAIQKLFTTFDAPIRDYLARIGHGDDPLRRRHRGTYRFNGGWSVRLRSAGYHNSHVHPRGWISSACYIDLPDGMDGDGQAGWLTFGVPSLHTTPALSVERSVRPQVGMLVLFPSYFWHGTVPFTSARTRLTVAFDVVPNP